MALFRHLVTSDEQSHRLLVLDLPVPFQPLPPCLFIFVRNVVSKFTNPSTLGAIQWLSNGDVSAFGDDGLFRGESSGNHMGVLWKYSEILAPCVEQWQKESVVDAKPRKSAGASTSEDSAGRKDQNYMLFLQQKSLPKLGGGPKMAQPPSAPGSR